MDDDDDDDAAPNELDSSGIGQLGALMMGRGFRGSTV